MVCFEVFLNGKRVCRAGGEQVFYIHTNVSYLKEENRSKFVVNGMNYPSGESSKLTESVHWAKDTELKFGDEIHIRIVESNEADSFQVGHSFGTRIHPDGETEYFCTLCGKNARDVGMLIHPNANICHDCLSRHRPKQDDPGSNPAVNTDVAQ